MVSSVYNMAIELMNSAVLTCRRPVKHNACQNCSMDGGDVPQTHSPAKELLAIAGCLGRENHFFFLLEHMAIGKAPMTHMALPPLAMCIQAISSGFSRELEEKLKKRRRGYEIGMKMCCVTELFSEEI